jgi:hypothetical protein
VRRRRAFVAALALVAALAVVAVSAVRAHDHSARPRHPATGRSSVAGPRATAAGTALAGDSGTAGTVVRKAVSLRTLDRELTAALARALTDHTGNLAVGLVDRTTGLKAVYGGGRQFHTASIVKADILAALLLRHQVAGTPLSENEQELATLMIEESDNDAATDLWGDVGATDGMAEANAQLGLRHTTPGGDYYWGLTETTVADQLQLLADLTSSRSPLNTASRSYELSLMRHVDPGQAWGVTAAATPKTPAAVKNGWLPDPQFWVINSIGVIRHNGQVLLVAVLSDDQPTEAGGIAQVKAAAVAAADAAFAAHS